MASHLDSRSRTDTHSTAVIIGDDGPHGLAVASALDAEVWRVADTQATGKALVAVAVVDRVTAQDASAVVSEARTSGDIVIVVLGEPTVEAVRALLQAGADAVVPVDAVETQLGPALTAVQAGLAAAPRGTLSQAIERPALTPREKQALGMVVLGFSNADIANKLYVAESTVKSHLSSAFAKLGVRTRSEATALILDRSNGIGTGILAIVGDGDAETA